MTRSLRDLSAFSMLRVNRMKNKMMKDLKTRTMKILRRKAQWDSKKKGLKRKRKFIQNQ